MNVIRFLIKIPIYILMIPFLIFYFFNKRAVEKDLMHNQAGYIITIDKYQEKIKNKDIKYNKILSLTSLLFILLIISLFRDGVISSVITLISAPVILLQLIRLSKWFHIKSDIFYQNGNIHKGKLVNEYGKLYKKFSQVRDVNSLNVVKRKNNSIYIKGVKKQHINANFPNIECIYGWITKKNQLLYIGKTNNLQRRVNEHIKGILGLEKNNETKYNTNVELDDIYIAVLWTDVEVHADQLSVMETLVYKKCYGEHLLNDMKPITDKKLYNDERYNKYL